MTDLSTLAEELSFSDITELLARRTCILVRHQAKQVINNEPNESLREDATNTIENIATMSQRSREFAARSLFDHAQLSTDVDYMISRVAEEYVR